MPNVKNIGKPCAGKPHARFDEGGQVNPVMLRLLRHRQTKGVETDRPELRQGKPALYSTLEIEALEHLLKLIITVLVDF